MSSIVAETTSPLPPHEEGFVPYRALSSRAAACLALGVLSLLALIDWAFALVPVTGMVLGVLAIVAIRRDPGLTGERLAWAGIALSALFLTLGLSFHSYVYATEVPDGYQRLTFRALQTDDRDPTTPPAEVASLVGQKVFLKGYIRPGKYETGIKEFLLVKDDGACCYGPTLPKPGDMVEVTLLGDRSVDQTGRLVKLGGVLRIGWKPMGAGAGVLYHVDADYLP